MKKIPLMFLTGCLLLANTRIQAQRVTTTDNVVSIAGEQNELRFNTANGLIEIRDGNKNSLAQNAYFQLGGLQSKDKAVKRSYTVEDINDRTGRGKVLSVRLQVDRYADILWRATVYEKADHLIFQMGVDNDTDRPYQLKAFYPFISRQVYPGQDNRENYKVLEGAGGGARTLVSSDTRLTSFNNLLARFGPAADTRLLVAGGASYHDFDKYVTVARTDKNLQLTLMGDDPVGLRVDAGTTYWPDDKFYLSFAGPDPFTALERYGRIVKQTQQIKLNYYDFPTECLWYASFYNNEPGRRKFNDSKGAVEEMENAIKSGITNYTRVAIRLVPDAYGPDNQQGWWDDRHWGMYGEAMSTEGAHYIAPYLTTKSWAGAIRKLGGIPITYFQTGRRSDDYALAHPDHMLFNDPYRVIAQPERFLHRVHTATGYDQGYYNHWWTDKMLWSYDFTDPGFVAHMDSVYANLHEAGIAGVMYDYPEVTGYAYEGGFEDPHATAARAYRDIYRLAYKGLGDSCYLNERNLLRGSDITLGLVASQRVWADTDGITPEMVTRCGLRWYKNRVVVNYDMDSKDPCDALPKENNDGSRAMLTMCYVTGGRFLLGRSFKQLPPDYLHDLSRTFPYHTSEQSARPLDAFADGVAYPRVYDFAVSPEWHQLTFYNNATDQDGHYVGQTLRVALSDPLNAGGMALDASQSYYVYDFWNNCLRGKLRGDEVLEQTLRPGEARMLSVRKAEKHPQYLSTDRHVMQSYLDMKECVWEATRNTLKGTSSVVGGEAYRIVLAGNGQSPRSCKARGAKATMRTLDKEKGLYELSLTSKVNRDITWEVSWK